MPNYRLSRRAAADIGEIADFTAERWGVAQASTYLDGLEALLHMIASRPMMGRSAVQVMPDLRRVRHKSHLIFYKTVPRGIRIERVLHTSRALKKSDFRA